MVLELLGCNHHADDRLWTIRNKTLKILKHKKNLIF